MPPAFDIIGPPAPESPVVLSVPHAGRDYPMALRAALRVPVTALTTLEDRHADTLARAARGIETLIVQRHPRAWIDLNRAETDRDPEVDEGAIPVPRSAGGPSPKVRSGLGLVPRRASGTAPIWRRRLAADEVAARIASDHRPYHAALADLLATARARFGVAVLLDIHSMPPLPSGAAIVFGDRYGKSAAARFVARLEAEAAAAGMPTAINTPYAGGHVLERHGRPRDDIHAIQVEIDRRRYLDPSLDQPGKGFEAMAAMLRAMLGALTDEALSGFALAAE